MHYDAINRLTYISNFKYFNIQQLIVFIIWRETKVLMNSDLSSFYPTDRAVQWSMTRGCRLDEYIRGGEGQ